jgi:hypothetical protein
MKNALQGIVMIFSRKDSRLVAVFSGIVLFVFLLVLQNGKATLQVFSLSFLLMSEMLFLASKTFFDVKTTFTNTALFLGVVGSVLGGVNMGLAYTYMKIRGEVILKSGVYQGFGLVLAFLGIGCAACGTALLSLILGMFGFSTVLSIFPYGGQEVGYIGVLLLLMATYSLAKKVIAPNVC